MPTELPCTSHHICTCKQARFKAMEDWLRHFVDKDGFIGAAEHEQARALLMLGLGEVVCPTWADVLALLDRVFHIKEDEMAADKRPREVTVAEAIRGSMAAPNEREEFQTR